METRSNRVPPKAQACMAHGWSFADRYGPQRCLAFSGFLSGLTLGLAISHIDPEWARQACGQIVEHQAAIWGQAGIPPESRRLQTWKEAQELIRAAARIEAGRPEGEGER